jgi:hypothetical protein
MHGDARRADPSGQWLHAVPARADGHASTTLPCYRPGPNRERAAELNFGRSE